MPLKFAPLILFLIAVVAVALRSSGTLGETATSIVLAVVIVAGIVIGVLRKTKSAATKNDE